MMATLRVALLTSKDRPRAKRVGRQPYAMDLFSLIAAVLEIFGSVPGRRVTVKERYEMKKRVRALKKRERAQLAKPPHG
jgi:hypothetical protein